MKEEKVEDKENGIEKIIEEYEHMDKQNILWNELCDENVPSQLI